MSLPMGPIIPTSTLFKGMARPRESVAFPRRPTRWNLQCILLSLVKASKIYMYEGKVRILVSEVTHDAREPEITNQVLERVLDHRCVCLCMCLYTGAPTAMRVSDLNLVRRS